MRLIDADALSKIIENTYLEGDSKLSFRIDSATEDTLIGKFQTLDIISDMSTVDIFEQISDEINKLKKVNDGNKVYVGINDVFDIIDKYKYR